MDYILLFLRNNWQIILAIILVIIQIVLTLCKKQVKIDTIKEAILDKLPLCISLAEEILGSGNGLEKHDLALGLVKRFLNISTNDHDAFISSAIEKILSTPEKKNKEVL